MTLTTVFGNSLLELIIVAALCYVAFSIVTSSEWMYLIIVALVYGCVKALRRTTAGSINVEGQGVLITGCDTGFGHDLARCLDQHGFTVFAGCLNPECDGAKKLKKESLGRLHIVSLDVGSDESVQAAHDYVVKHLSKAGLWAIVNNAGFNVMGDVEWLTIDLFHKAMNVNFYGTVRTTRTFLYLVRKTKGRVLVVTSVKGLIPWPADAAYHVTKHALETMADSLRLEMKKFQVKVAKIQPGKFNMATACQSPEQFRRYRKEADEMWDSASNDVKMTYGRKYLDKMLRDQERTLTGSAKTTKPVIDAMVDAIMSDRPNTSYLVDGGDGWMNGTATLARYYGFLPTWLSDWIIYKRTKCDRFPA